MTTEGGVACDRWDNSGCVGNPYCPPRCPRFVDDSGIAYVVRPYRSDDRPALVEMYAGLGSGSRTMGLPPSTPAQIEAWLDGLVERGWNLVARTGDRIAGHVGVAPAEAPQFVIFVDDDHQNHGLGTELVNQTIAYAADRDYEALTLSVSKGNRRAIHVYRNVGFGLEDAAQELSASGVDLDMRLPLSSPVADLVRLPPAER